MKLFFIIRLSERGIRVIRSTTKRLLTATAILALVMSGVLSACSSKDNGQAKPSSTASQGQAAATETPKASETPKVEETPKIHIVTSHQNTGYIKAVTNWEDDPYVKRMEEMSGYDINYEFLAAYPDYSPQLTVRFASGDLPDLIWTTGIENPAHAGAVDQGALLDLTDLIEQYGPNIKQKVPEELWSDGSISKNGKIYGIPLTKPYSEYTIVFYRQDWLEKAGMTELKTVDDYLKFFEFIKTNDMNGNGKADEYGFYARENMASSEIFFGTFGVLPSKWQLKDGQVIPDMITPEMKQAVQFWRMLYEKGYVNPDMFTKKGLDWDAGIRNGQAGTWVHSVNNYYSWTIDYVDPNAKIGMLPSPIGENGMQGLGMKGTKLWNVWIVPAKTENPERVIKFLDWAWGDPNAEEFFAFGIEGRNFTRENGKIVWDETNPRNMEDDEKAAYQYVMNPTGLAAGNEKSMDVLEPELRNALIQGYKDAEISGMTPGVKGIPTPEAFKTNPELAPGFGPGTLFLDMFAKVITGREPLDPAFDNFVAEWKKRGGDAAIKETTEWYNSTQQS